NILTTPAFDSQYCMMTVLSTLGGKPDYGNAVLYNSTARLGKDTLYEVSFYAKIHYSPAKPFLSDSVLVVIQDYTNGYPNSLVAVQGIDTTWKKYTIGFRAASGGLQKLIFGVGNKLCDVEFDAVSIKQRE